MKPRKKPMLAFVSTGLLLAGLFFWAVNTGSLWVTPAQLFHGLFVGRQEQVAILLDLRIPRILIAMVGGGAMAVSGVLLQAVLKNPLADPGIIGVGAGAGLAAAVTAVLFPSWYLLTPLLACAGGGLAFGLVYALSWQGGLSPVRIILVGVAVNALFSGMSNAIAGLGGGSLVGPGALGGGLGLKTWRDVHLLAGYSLVGMVGSLAVAGRCNLLALEDQTARSLGIHVHRSRLVVSALAVLLASMATAVVGPVSFLGLLVPHIARLLVGSDHRVLTPYAALLGACALLLADTLGRCLFPPYEISAAVIMAVVGGPCFILLLRRWGHNYGP